MTIAPGCLTATQQGHAHPRQHRPGVKPLTRRSSGVGTCSTATGSEAEGPPQVHPESALATGPEVKGPPRVHPEGILMRKEETPESPLSRVDSGAYLVGATGFEPATTCTPTAAGTLAPGLTAAHAVVASGFAGVAPRSTAHVGAPGSTPRMACTAPALRSSGLPAPEPALFLTAGGIVARLWPAQETVIWPAQHSRRRSRMPRSRRIPTGVRDGCAGVVARDSRAVRGFRDGNRYSLSTWLAA